MKLKTQSPACRGKWIALTLIANPSIRSVAFGLLMTLGGIAHAASFTVDSLGNASLNSPLPTISLTAGQQFTVFASTDDLWSLGALPRWSNADGLTGNRFATGSDESGESAGTLIGQDFGLLTQNGFTAPFGALVGKVGSTFILLGTSFTGLAPESGTLLLMNWDTFFTDNTNSIVANVSVVPVPAAAWLLGSAMLGLLGLTRRKQAA